MASGSVEYTESGLDNILLENVPVWRCPNGHEDVQIPAVNELHQVIAKSIVAQPWALMGDEIRFLRKSLGYSARQFSALVGLNYVTLSRFENERRPIPRKMDALVRLFFAQALCEKTSRPMSHPVISVLAQIQSVRLPLCKIRLSHHEPRHTTQGFMSAWQQEALAV